MSPSLLPEPEPQEQPAPEPVAPPKSGTSRKWLALIPVVAVAAAGWTWKTRQSTPAETAAEIRTARVVRGVVAKTIRLTGTVSAKRYSSVSAPLMQGPDQGRDMVLIHLGEPGTLVKKDQVIGQIDGQSISDHVNDVDAQVVQLQMEARRLQANQLVTMETYRQRARAAKAAWEQAVLSARAAPVRNPLDQELLQLQVEQTRLEYEESEKQLPLVAELQESERLIAKYRELHEISHRDRHRVDLQRFTMRSPMDGQLILKTLRRNNGESAQVRVGDQVAPGQSVLRVVDLGSMALEATMSQTDSEIIREGQKATVHFDAYPDLVLDGHVEAVGMLATSGRRANLYVRTVPVRIAIDARDSRVIPDLTGSADVMVDDEDGLVIPRDAVTESNGKPMVFVKQGEVLTAREVGIGSLSNTRAAIVSGLQEGEQVALQSDLPK